MNHIIILSLIAGINKTEIKINKKLQVIENFLQQGTIQAVMTGKLTVTEDSGLKPKDRFGD